MCQESISCVQTGNIKNASSCQMNIYCVNFMNQLVSRCLGQCRARRRLFVSLILAAEINPNSHFIVLISTPSCCSYRIIMVFHMCYLLTMPISSKIISNQDSPVVSHKAKKKQHVCAQPMRLLVCYLQLPMLENLKSL